MGRTRVVSGALAGIDGNVAIVTHQTESTDQFVSKSPDMVFPTAV